MNSNIFQTIKSFVTKEQFKDYISVHYGIEFKDANANAFCPFHSHDYKTPSLGIKTDNNGITFFHCFACNTSGDLVKFVELKEGITPTQAARKICDYFGIAHSIKEHELSKEELEAHHKKLMKQEAEAKRRADELAKKEAAKQVALKERLSLTAPMLVRDFKANYELIKDHMHELFPFCFLSNFTTHANGLLGYSFEHKSICAIITDKDGNALNIKYRQKFKYDTTTKSYLDVRMDGKWISEAGASAQPFPLNYFLNHTDERVIICEGEKDALNLLSLDVRCLTLGGVTASYTNYPEILNALRGKDIYIWFDHDEAGYLNAIKRYHELKSVARSIVIVCFFAIAKNLAPKYDISDFIKEHSSKFQVDANDVLFDLISFSCFKPTNNMLDEVSDYFKDIKPKLQKFREPKIVRYFDEITDEFLATDKDGNYINIFSVKGELDDEYINAILDKAKALEKELGNERYELFMNIYLSHFVITEGEKENFDKLAKASRDVFKIQKTLRTNYHQTHISDMVNSFSDTLLKLGYSLAQYKGELYFWTKTHFAKLDTTTLSNFIQVEWMPRAYVDEKKVSVRNAKEIIENLHNRAFVLDNLKREQTRRVINLTNGTLFISKNANVTFKEHHSKNDAALNILNFAFDPNAKCPKWRRFLKQILPDEHDRMALMEFIGYCFLPSHEYESFLFLYGKSGANGKSVILDVMRSFFGDENVSSLQLQQFEGHQMHGLTNKILNIGSEIDKNGTDKSQLSYLKSLVSTRDYVQINPKNEKPFNLLPSEKPKLAFAGNEKPKQNLDNGVFRRMLIIVFDKEVKDEQKIRGLSERFIDEMAGILNYALAALENLVKNGKFTRSKRMLAEIEEYKDDVNPMRAFVRDAIIADDHYYIPNNYLYLVYKYYISEKGGQPLSSKRFFTALKDEMMLGGKLITISRKRLMFRAAGLTDRPYCVFGIKLSDGLDFESLTIEGTSVNLAHMSIFSQSGAKPDEEVLNA